MQDYACALADIDHRLIAAVSYRIHTILTDDGIQFLYAPRYADGDVAPTFIQR